MPRTRSTASCRRPAPPPWCAGPSAPGSTRPWRAGRSSARRTTRCSARSSCAEPTASPPGAALVAALDDTAILGLTTNLGFLRALAASDEFRDATIDTAWLDQQHRRRRRTASCPGSSSAWVQAMLVASRTTATRSRPTAGATAPTRLRSWSSSTRPSPSTAPAAGSATIDVRPAGGRAPRGRCCSRSTAARERGRGQRRSRTSSRSSTTGTGTSSSGPTSSPTTAPCVGDGTILAPMPGTVLAVNVERRPAGRRGRGARRARGDEDGAGAQGTVRRHRQRWSAPRSATRSRSAPCCSRSTEAAEGTEATDA